MSILSKEIKKDILSLNRYSKRIIAIVNDVICCFLCTWLTFVLRLEQLIPLKEFNLLPVLISVILAIPIFWIFGIIMILFLYTLKEK